VRKERPAGRARTCRLRASLRALSSARRCAQGRARRRRSRPLLAGLQTPALWPARAPAQGLPKQAVRRSRCQCIRQLTCLPGCLLADMQEHRRPQYKCCASRIRPWAGLPAAPLNPGLSEDCTSGILRVSGCGMCMRPGALCPPAAAAGAARSSRSSSCTPPGPAARPAAFRCPRCRGRSPAVRIRATLHMVVARLITHTLP
jgi:hypothetical protein